MTRGVGDNGNESTVRLDTEYTQSPIILTPFLIPNKIICKSDIMKKVMAMAKRVAETNSTVLLTGETGTGKEVIADFIYHSSKRADKPYLKMNCAAFPETLIESELFGYDRGAFTGADKDHPGKFESADRGTILLDEIADMSLATQSKVLRVLQEKEFERLGSNKTRKTDVRIISSTNRSIKEKIRDGSFREDLYYRLNVIPINLPPLRERKRDIYEFTKLFIEYFCNQMGKEAKKLHPEALERLTNYDWPGNIRELKNELEKAVLVSDRNTIFAEELGIPYNGHSLEKVKNYDLKEIEKETILSALKDCNWVQNKAAKLLGVSERVLNYKIKMSRIRHPNWKANKGTYLSR